MAVVACPVYGGCRDAVGRAPQLESRPQQHLGNARHGEERRRHLDTHEALLGRLARHVGRLAQVAPRIILLVEGNMKLPFRLENTLRALNELLSNGKLAIRLENTFTVLTTSNQNNSTGSKV